MLLRKRGVLATVRESCVAGAARAHAIVDAVPALRSASRSEVVGAGAPCQDADEFPAGSPRELRSGGKLTVAVAEVP